MHSEKRGSWYKEGLLTAVTGVLFGATNVVVGQPLDTMKTKMQAQESFSKGGVIHTASNIWKQEGVRGFYRGCLPMLSGSMIYRSAQFSMYEMVWTKCEDIPSSQECIPNTEIQWRVLYGGIAGGTARSLLECPFEYAKVKRQTG